MPLIYENSCIGKALYGINVEVLSNDYSRISGINTTFSNGTVVTDNKFGTLTSNGNILEI